MPKYLIKLTPMEPYFFGGERTFGFGKDTKTKQPYYIVSEKMLSQPTLFGTLRYLVLAQNNALINQEKSGDAASLVGTKSFLFEKARKNEKQNFGKINGISPVFLVKDDVWYVRTPYNHNPREKNDKNKVYTPFEMDVLPVTSGSGEKLHPTDYKAKNGYGGGYVSLDKELKVIYDDDLFTSVVRTGVDSHRTETEYDNKSSFFKKERVKLEKGFSFAFIADVEDSFHEETTVVFMGQDKSPFRCEITETNEDLIGKVTVTFKGKNTYPVKYALSDVLPLGETFTGCDDYCIADTRVIRNLESDMNASSYYARLKKSEKLYRIINAGSVFYTDVKHLNNEALKVIGMNVFADISIKGEEI